jgi:DDE superfamily endonuclease
MGGRKQGFPVEIEHGAQKKLWMNKELMLHWVEKVWRPSTAQFDCTYLFLDCCTSHLTTEVKAAFDNSSMERDFIQKGYTCKLQPMDVGISKPAKN